MKKIMTMMLVALVAVSAFAQEQSKGDKFAPKKGDWALGISINPVAAGGMSYQPGKGDFLGNYISGLAENPQQMYMPSQSVTSISFKKFIKDNLAFKAALGFSGSHLNYTEYVSDDLATYYDPLSEDVVEDAITGNLGGGSLILGLESSLGKGWLRFVYGIDLVYTMGAGALNFTYGNEISVYNNYQPTTMGMTANGGKCNDYQASHLGIDWARPGCRNNIGLVQQIGLRAEAGLEAFVYDRISVGLTASFLPVAFTWQGQTWGQYEGFSELSGRIETYNRLVSPGSSAVTYGTNSLGINIAVNYYF